MKKNNNTNTATNNMNCWFKTIITSIIVTVTVMGICFSVYCYTIESGNQKINTKKYNNHESLLQTQVDSSNRDSLLTTGINRISCLESVQKEQAELKNDIRQETNNIINKFNGWIGFWMVILTVICGIAPIALAFRQHTYSQEMLRTQKEDLTKLKTELEKMQSIIRKESSTFKEEKDRWAKERIEIVNNSREVNEKLTNQVLETIELCKTEVPKSTTRVDFYLSYIYISAITRAVDFQSSKQRLAIADFLLFNLIHKAIMFYEANLSDNNHILRNITDYRIWINTLSNGMRNLIIFQTSRMRERKIQHFSDMLMRMRDIVFSINDDKMQLADKGKQLYEELSDMYFTEWPHEDNRNTSTPHQ